MSEFSDLVTRERPLSIRRAPGGKSGALLATYEGGAKAIIKAPKVKLPSGYRRQRGILAELHPTREVAFYRAAVMLGCADLVPETVLTTKAIDGVVASAQMFMPIRQLHQMQPRLEELDRPGWGLLLEEACSVVPKRFWKSLLVLDIVGGSRDRHSNNIGIIIRVDDDDKPMHRIVAFDNAVSFGLSFDRYHNVFHKHIFRRSIDLGDAWSTLDKLTLSDVRTHLNDLLQPDEISHALMRAKFFVDFPYRLPWRVCSKGNDDPNSFPDYRNYFFRHRDVPLHMRRVPV